MNYGINGSISVAAARPIEVASTTPIALVGDTDVGATGLFFYGSATLALAHVANATTGVLRTALELIEKQGVSAPIILGVVRTGLTPVSSPLTPLPVDPTKADIINMIDRLKFAEAETGYKPSIIIAPVWSFDLSVASAMVSMAERFWAFAILDNLATTETLALAYASNFSSRFALIYSPYVKYYDTVVTGDVTVASSSIIAAMIARGDGEVPFGFADSVSNRPVLGISGTQRIIEYADGQDSEARRLRNAGIGSIVKDVGWRTYGFETTDIDPIWQNAERVRTFYAALTAVMQASKWARDRRANELVYVRDSVDQFMRELRGNNVAIGFEIYFDMKKNTLATVTAGKFYLTVKWQNMPTIRELNIEMIYTDAYGKVLLNIINGG